MQTGKADKKFLRAVQGHRTEGVPFWFMRQAGRYLPEYRQVRAQAGGFLKLAFDPDKAAEVTLQPLRRFGMDAAILFSDILVVPLALGQDVRFAEGEGPILAPFRDAQALSLDRFDERLAPVYETLRLLRGRMAAEGFHDAALIGFAGAPWTVACYMVEGGSSPDFVRVKNWAAQDPESFGKLIDLLTLSTVRYLRMQIEAGAEAVQLFDSWAGLLDGAAFRRWVIGPASYIADKLRETHPDVPLIGFPRGAGSQYADYARLTGVAALGLDPQVSLGAALDLQNAIPVQGNLDPALLLAGGDAMYEAAARILDTLGGGPFVFNLGHGIVKETPPEHVAQLSEQVKSWRR